MKRTIAISLLSILFPCFLFSQETDSTLIDSTIVIDNGDTIPSYDAFVSQLNSGNYAIDYVNFRISYIYSDDFKKKSISTNYHNLKREIYTHISNSELDSIIKKCNLMLEIDYTSMFAHKYLQQTAKITRDSLLYHKHHEIEFGLLKSIVKNGDGRSCASSWEVTQLEEEYFILDMIGAQLKKQVLDGGCDRMHVKMERKKKVYYFGVYYVFLSRKL